MGEAGIEDLRLRLPKAERRNADLRRRLEKAEAIAGEVDQRALRDTIGRQPVRVSG